MGERLAQLGEAMDRRDLLEVVLLAVAMIATRKLDWAALSARMIPRAA